jgi:hypothetical protein
LSSPPVLDWGNVASTAIAVVLAFFFGYLRGVSPALPRVHKERKERSRIDSAGALVLPETCPQAGASTLDAAAIYRCFPGVEWSRAAVAVPVGRCSTQPDRKQNSLICRHCS